MNVARIWLALGRQDKENRYLTRAYAILQNLLPRLMELECIEIVIEVLILQALTLQEMDKMDEALNIVQQAYALSEPEGFRRVFLDEGLPMARLTARLLNRQKRGSLLPAELPTRGFLSEVLRLFSGASGDMVDVELPERNALAAASAGAPDSFDLLTTREIEVLRLVAGGASNADIARELFLAVNTVKRHLNNIFLKLGATTRTQAVSIARQIGLIE
jgi:LuxR family maltose regulon positive regulatory protein